MSSTLSNPLTCPMCKSIPLQRGRYRRGQTELDVCQKCRGIWFDRDEFEHVFDIGAKQLRADSDLRMTRRYCPKCRRVLREMTYPQTDIDVLICVDCDGVWATPEQINAIKRQRYRLERTGELDAFAPTVGLKGRWISYVNETIEQLQREYERLK